MGIVSETFLAKINNKLTNDMCYNQWCSTSTVIEWFRAIESKKTCQFIKFDIAEIYPPILGELLETSMNFTKSII